MEPVIAYLGMGSNLGQREENLTTAIKLLGQAPAGSCVDPNEPGSSLGMPSVGVCVLRASSIYETQPWGYKDQPDFLNCVLEVSTRLSPWELLERLKEIEEIMGRMPSLRYGPRLIDIDILFYHNLILQHPDLRIPHPRLHQRAFVLVPLAELNRGLVHPVLHASIGDLHQGFDDAGMVSLWGPPPVYGKD